MMKMMFKTCGSASLLALPAAVPQPRTLKHALSAAQQRSRTIMNASTTTEPQRQSSGPARVLIVGGGFGGLYAAIRLNSLFWPKSTTPQITLVDQAERFTFKPLLYELINNTASEDEVAPYFSQLLAPYPVQFIQSKVLSVEPQDPAHGMGGKVQLEGDATLEYDWLVMALGSSSDSKGIPGVKELALPFNVYNDAVRVKEALDLIEAANKPSSTIMVVGAGYAGVELATVVAERVKGRATVYIVTPNDDILDGSPEGQREAAKSVLKSLGVEVLAGTKVKQLKEPDNSPLPGSLPSSCTVDIQIADGTSVQMPVDLVLWSAGASPVTKDSQERKGFPFPINPKGSIQTESTLQVKEHDRVFALGDVSGPDYEAQGTADGTSPSGPPATAQVAFQQADYVAWNIWASINGRKLLPFRYQHLGSMMSLGQLNAAVALPVDVPLPVASTLKGSPLGPLLDAAGIKLGGSNADGGVTLQGPLAAIARRVAYLYRQPTNEQRLNVATSWAQKAFSLPFPEARSAERS